MGRNGHGPIWLWAEMTGDQTQVCRTGDTVECSNVTGFLSFTDIFLIFRPNNTKK